MAAGNQLQLGRYKKLEDTGLWQHLKSSSEREQEDLATKVQKAASEAEPLLERVASHMPLYTLHNKRHILNVIAWMERLLGPKGIENLSPLECALCILSAYVHDLGMTLSPEEYADTLDEKSDSEARRAYLRFRDGFLEERAEIERLRKGGLNFQAGLIESHLLTEHIRRTHADRDSDRMKRRLDEIAEASGDAKLFEYRAVPFREALELIAISHNQPVNWLRAETEKQLGSVRTTVGDGEPVNYGLVGLLLRLADIMDFDSSRTPTILFRHIGLDHELANRFEKISQQEWRKHLAVDSVEWPADRLTYLSHRCPHPAIDKSIRQFVGWIQDEVSGARGELERLRNEENDPARCGLDLPADVEAKIIAERRNGKPIYTYHDWHFELDQQEIIRLLMGESLYGDPSLCIRELLQNALDAVELRDLRLQLLSVGGQPEQPVDGESLGPGRFKFGGKEEALEVRLTWGEEGGRQYIRLEDNGTGMTEDVIQRFFTRVGKSYYRSPDFRREREALREKGLFASPISTFGIGVLSSFMVADRISVRTHPGKADGDERKPVDLEVSGPGSLFWTKPGTRQRQGTEVTLWLRSQLRGNPVRLVHDWNVCRRELREHFGYESKDRESEGYQEPGNLDPGMVAAKHVVWPKYPIQVIPQRGEVWTIDERFHFDRLTPIDVRKLHEKAKEWDMPPEALGDPHWAVLDWKDESGVEATGTRIRLWYPKHFERGTRAELPPDPPPGLGLLPLWQLGSLAEPQLSSNIECRWFTLVQGMHVPARHVLLRNAACAYGPGAYVWIDFRGEAAPRLTADRREALTPGDDPSEWGDTLEHVFRRWHEHLTSQLGDTAEVLNLLFLFPSRYRNDMARCGRSKGSAALIPSSEYLLGNNKEQGIDFVAASFALDRAFARAFARDRALDVVLARDRALARTLDCALALARDRALALASALVRNRALARAGALDLALARVRALDLAREPDEEEQRSLLAHTYGSFLQEAFFPDLRRSWPVLDVFGLEGRIGDAALTAPASFLFQLDGRKVVFADSAGTEPRSLANRDYGYDLCLPMSSIPIGELRRQCASWREDRSIRAVAILPFLFPFDPGVAQGLASRVRGLLPGFKQLYAFAPRPGLWFQPFEEWTEADWNHEGNWSYLWNLESGAFLAARGRVPIGEMQAKGRPFLELAGLSGRSARRNKTEER